MRTKAIVGAWALLWAACGGTEQRADEPAEDVGTAGQEQAAGEGESGAAAEGEGEGAGSGKPSAIETLGISGPEDKSWEEMSADEREWYMVGKVLPIMKEIFARFEAEEESFEDVQCETCHGQDMREVEFAMPSAELPVVPHVGTPEYTQMREEHGPMVKFMEQEVTPTMGKLLGMDGYSCEGCHPTPQ
ncbi:MAG: multiheme c-type cytochrome [Polyangiales bacterium]